MREDERAHRRAQPRGDGALRLVALHARPQAQGTGCTASAFRRWCCGAPPTASLAESYGRAFAAAIPGRALRADRARRPFPASRAARSRSPARRSPSPRSIPATEPYRVAGNAGLSFHRAALSRRLERSRRLAARQPAEPQSWIRRSRPTCCTAITTNGSSPTSSASTSWSTSITRPRPACRRP